MIPETNQGTPRDGGPLFMEQKYDSKNNEIRMINIEDYIQIMPFNSAGATTNGEPNTDYIETVNSPKVNLFNNYENHSDD